MHHTRTLLVATATLLLALGCGKDDSSSSGPGSGGSSATATGGSSPTENGGGAAVGSAPVVVRAAYFSTASGPKMLAEGTFSGSLETLTVSYLDDKLKPVTIDLKGDGSEMVDHVEVAGAPFASDGAFYMELQGGTSLSESVAAVEFKAVDGAGLASEPVVARLDDRPERDLLQTCDPRGFDTCISPGTCAALLTAPPACTTVKDGRLSRCGDGGNVSTAGSVVTGTTRTGLLWHAPESCLSAQLTPLGEQAFHFSIASAATVIVTTNHPGTAADTVIIVTEECGETIVGCNDDDGTAGSSTVVLPDLPAGDYGVVVQSLLATEATFELSVAIE